MEINDIIKLIEVVSENGLTSFELEENGSKLSMKKEKETIVTASAAVPVQLAVPTDNTALSGTAVSTPSDSVKTTEKSAGGKSIDTDRVVKSPLVGTFFDAPSTEASPFVKVGDTVKKGQVLGIIEAMKLLNEIESEFDGVVEAILVKNGEVVEYGQPMFRIK